MLRSITSQANPSAHQVQLYYAPGNQQNAATASVPATGMRRIIEEYIQFPEALQTGQAVCFDNPGSHSRRTVIQQITHACLTCDGFNTANVRPDNRLSSSAIQQFGAIPLHHLPTDHTFISDQQSKVRGVQSIPNVMQRYSEPSAINTNHLQMSPLRPRTPVQHIDSRSGLSIAQSRNEYSPAQRPFSCHPPYSPGYSAAQCPPATPAVIASSLPGSETNLSLPAHLSTETTDTRLANIESMLTDLNQHMRHKKSDIPDHHESKCSETRSKIFNASTQTEHQIATSTVSTQTEPIINRLKRSIPELLSIESSKRPGKKGVGMTPGPGSGMENRAEQSVNRSLRPWTISTYSD